jgi:hypothetical protein
MEEAAALPLGLDTRMEFGVCDGLNLQLLADSDLVTYRKAPASGGEVGTLTVLLRVHRHGKALGEVLANGAAACGEEDLPTGQFSRHRRSRLYAGERESVHRR